MADTKISALTAATTPLAGTEVLPIVQGGVTKKVTVADLTAGRAVSVASLTATGNVTANNISVADTNWIGWGNYATRFSGTGGGNLNVVTNSITAGVWDTSQNYTAYGNLIQGTAAKGINFTANSALAGKTSQLLNYYEEGTWTPTITAYSGTITTSSSSSANYTRVGNVVTFSVVLTVTNNGTGAGYLIFTLPFSGSKGYASAIGVNTSSGVTVSGSSDSSNPSTMYMQKTDGTYPIASGQSLRVTGTYLV